MPMFVHLEVYLGALADVPPSPLRKELKLCPYEVL